MRLSVIAVAVAGLGLVSLGVGAPKGAAQTQWYFYDYISKCVDPCGTYNPDGGCWCIKGDTIVVH